MLVPQLFFDCEKVFSPDPDQSQFTELSYTAGLNKVFTRLYGYLLLIVASQVLNVLLQNIANSVLIRIASKQSSGTLDIVYQKMLVLSDATRQATASGNITNLLFTDTQKIA